MILRSKPAYAPAFAWPAKTVHLQLNRPPIKRERQKCWVVAGQHVRGSPRATGREVDQCPEARTTARAEGEVRGLGRLLGSDVAGKLQRLLVSFPGTAPA